MTNRSPHSLYISIILCLTVTCHWPLCAGNITILPIDPSEETFNLLKGETYNISLRANYDNSETTLSYKTLVVTDTIAVHVDCNGFTFTSGFPLVDPPKSAGISVTISRIVNGLGSRYAQINWNIERQSTGSYLINDSGLENNLVLYPGTYKLIYDGIDNSETIVFPISSEDDKARSSVLLTTYSNIDVTLKCFEVESGMIPRIAPTPEVLPSIYGTGSAFGSAGVTEIGSASYDFDIELPKHRFTPHIGISYNSMTSGYGLAGYGVSVTGLSSITRTGSNLYYDNDYKGISYTDNDNFLFDGKRLIPVVGKPNNYVIEGNPFTTVVRHGSGSEMWFSLEENGIAYEYGHTDTSVNTSEKYGSSVITEWYIDKATDPNGNYAVYIYENSSGTVYPIRISYGMNSSASGVEQSSVVFEYKSLGANSRSFMLGARKCLTDRCISSIRSWTSREIFRKYDFEYDETSDLSSGKYTRLSRILVSNGAGESLSPVVFSWNYLAGLHTTCVNLRSEIENTIENSKEKSFQFLSSDVNGDGISDIIKISTVTDKTAGTYAYVSLSQRDLNGRILFGEPVRHKLPTVMMNANACNFLNTPSILDVDGDGLNDFVFSFQAISNEYYHDWYSVIYGKNIPYGGDETHESFYVPLKSDKMSFSTIADFDGDGRDEIIYIDPSIEDKSLSGGIIDYEGNLNFHRNLYQFKSETEPKNFLSADFNNDGLIDIMIVYEKQYTIYYNRGGKDLAQLFNDVNKYTGTQFGNEIRMTQGDFNGDGIVDLVYFDSSVKKLAVAKNNGDGTFDIDFSEKLDVSLSDEDSDNSITVCDFDHDGYADVVVAVKSSDKIKTRWFYCDGTTLHQYASFEPISRNDDIQISSSIFVGDFDGDGIEELINYGQQLNFDSQGSTADCFRVYRNLTSSPSEGKLTSVTDGTGRGMYFTYSTLTDPNIYRRDDCVYPLKSTSMPLSVVSKTKELNADSDPVETSYSYENLRFHVTGRGSLGFSNVSKYTPLTATRQITQITELDDRWFIPRETVSRTIIDKDTLLTVTTNRITEINGTSFSHTATERSIDADGNKSETSYVYDNANGQLLTRKTVFDGQDMYRSESYSDYLRAGNRWLPQKSESAMKHSDDTSPYVVKTGYVYDSNGNLVKKTENLGTDMELRTNYSYDIFGNVVSTLAEGNGVIPVSKYFEYDDNGRFLKRTLTSPASAVITYTYDRWGNMLTETDETDTSNRLVRTMTYDGWNRRVTDTAPDGTVTSYRYGWGKTDEYRNYVKTTTADGHEETTWLDSRGRTRLVKTVGPGGVTVATATHYDAIGRVSLVESFNGKLVLEKAYTYDHRGRPLSIIGSGRTTLYSYSNRKVTANNGGRVVTSVSDAWGNVISSIESGTRVTYRYLSNGKPSEIECGGSIVRMKYDSAGNLIELRDPDAGINTHSYAADGTHLSHTDGRGITTRYSFDNLGRVTSVRTGDRVVTDTYGTQGYSLQRLASRSDGSNRIDYTYDRYGRTIKESRVVDGKGTFVYEFAYNDKGQLSKTIYPGGLEVTYEYDLIGNKIAVKADGKSVWTFKDNDGLCQRSDFMGVMRYNRTYDDNGLPTEIGVNAIPGKSLKISKNISLVYDAATGNLVSRRQCDNPTRVYAYDSMHRLVSVTSGGNEILSMEYSGDGNITYKSDVGDYDYLSTRPHAVTRISNPAPDVPVATQTVTYGDLGKISSIEEDDWIMTYDYGPDGERWQSALTDCGAMERETVYFGSYERVTAGGVSREYYFIEGNVLVVKERGVFTPYFIFTDERGSILSVSDANGMDVFAANYDEWGAQEVIYNSIGLRLGYTCHEMMPEFGVINMNGRLYDPLFARFFSPDNYVQEPSDSQNFNRYSYCLNNPLKYVDESGEFLGIDDLFVSLAGAAVGYFTNAIKTGHWGWKSVKAGIASAFSAVLGYHSLGLLSGNITHTAYISSMTVSSLSNSFLPSVKLPITSFMGLSFSPIMGFDNNCLWMNLTSSSLFFKFGDDWNVSISTGGGYNYGGISGFVSYKDWGAGFGLTKYAENGKLGAQTVGTISLLLSGVSLRLSNDAFGDKEDRWRTNAFEIGYKDYVLGSSIFTNDGANESWEIYDSDGIGTKTYTVNKKTGQEDPFFKDENSGSYRGCWNNGKVYAAPLWIGLKKGHQIYRIGYSSPIIQELTQNLVHRTIVPTPLFRRYGEFEKGLYFYSGRNSEFNFF